MLTVIYFPLFCGRICCQVHEHPPQELSWPSRPRFLIWYAAACNSVVAEVLVCADGSRVPSLFLFTVRGTCCLCCAVGLWCILFVGASAVAQSYTLRALLHFVFLYDKTCRADYYLGSWVRCVRSVENAYRLCGNVLHTHESKHVTFC
jgi:hypothetical protein